MTTAPAVTPVVPLTPPKLIATDLDGTLLRSDGTLSGRTAAALAAAEAGRDPPGAGHGPPASQPSRR